MKQLALLLMLLAFVSPLSFAKGGGHGRAGGFGGGRSWNVRVGHRSKHQRSPKVRGCSMWTKRSKCHTVR